MNPDLAAGRAQECAGAVRRIGGAEASGGLRQLQTGAVERAARLRPARCYERDPRDHAYMFYASALNKLTMQTTMFHIILGSF